MSVDLSPSDKAELLRMKRKLDGVSGPGVRHTKDTLYIGPSMTMEPPRRQIIPPPAVQFIITGSESGGGKYTALILNAPVVDIPATGDLSADELGLGGYTIIRACNTREQGMSTHDLTSGIYMPVRFTGYFLRVAADGVPVYVFDGRQGEDCT